MPFLLFILFSLPISAFGGDVSPLEVKAALSSPRPPLLVDVRSPADFDRVRIPGSLNLPLYRLKKGFPAGAGPWVIVHRGLPSREITEALSPFQDGRVSLLAGGLLSWAEAGLPLEGSSPALGALRGVSPAEFLSSKKTSWTLLDVSGGRARPEAQPLPLFRKKAPAAASLRRKMGEHPGARFLLVGAAGDDGRLQSLLSGEKWGGNVFFLTGGWEALDESEALRAALSSPGAGRRVTLGNNPCADKSAGVPACQ